NKGKLTKAQERRYYSNSDKALEAFLQRKTSGLNLSERVWNYAGQFKEKIELALDLGIRNGLSAAEMARELKQYLREPDKLFRRVRDQHGQLRLSQAAKAYHPGQGVCRSGYKNARRMAATETNIAYRTADFLRWQQLDFVVGMEVRLSGNHPLPDICDDLKGKYPKDFKFTGWHPCCRCYAIPILKTSEDSGTESDSANTVHEPPEGFQNWLAQNRDRIERAKSLPYFLRDNGKYVKDFKLIPSAQSEIREAAKAKAKAETWTVVETQNGKIQVSSLHGKNEKRENIEIASYFANKYGHEIELLAKSNESKSPDVFNKTLNIEQEYKRNSKATVSALDNELRDAAKQADNIVFDIRSEISDGDLKKGIQDRARRCKNLKTVTVIRNGEDKTYSITDILKDDWTL
ncbi:MAG: hypothetical protein LBG92_02275, partial [Prevotellaceae bacterium]|nr:hypothetical protein [Prevotellaceae bacterium]